MSWYQITVNCYKRAFFVIIMTNNYLEINIHILIHPSSCDIWSFYIITNSMYAMSCGKYTLDVESYMRIDLLWIYFGILNSQFRYQRHLSFFWFRNRYTANKPDLINCRPFKRITNAWPKKKCFDLTQTVVALILQNTKISALREKVVSRLQDIAVRG